MKKNANANKWARATQLVRGGTLRSNYGETSEAIFLNSGFCYDKAETAEKRFNGEEPGFVYSRYVNPNLAMLQERLCLIEGAESCIVMASGMAAVFAAFMCQLRSGDHVVASKVMFSSCNYIITELLPRWGIEVTLVAGTEKADWQKAMKKNTRLVFMETPGNPTLEIVDIKMVVECAKKVKARVIVDNVFAGPLLQKPLELGADIVIYSTTKHMDGQGRTLGGAVLGSKKFIEEELQPFHRHTGPALSPFNAWVIFKGLETYEMRYKQHCENALMVALFLSKHPKVKKVMYPGLKSHPQHKLAMKQMLGGGAMIGFELRGGKKEAFKFQNALEIIDISNNLGDAKSLITHPATTTHTSMDRKEREKIGITEGFLRLSVGLEDADDLVSDIVNALKKV